MKSEIKNQIINFRVESSDHKRRKESKKRDKGRELIVTTETKTNITHTVCQNNQIRNGSLSRHI